MRWGRSTQGRPPSRGRRLQLVKGLAPENRWKKPWYPPLPQPLLTTAYKIRPIIVFQGLVFCPALWLKDPARRGMILPLPRVHRTGLDDFHFKLRVDGAHQPPQTPKPHRHMRLTRISIFPGPQKQKDPKGFRVAYICGDSGGLVNSERPSP